MPAPARHARTSTWRSAGRVRSLALLTLAVVVVTVSGSAALGPRATSTAAQQEAVSLATGEPATVAPSTPEAPAPTEEPTAAGSWDDPAAAPTDAELGAPPAAPASEDDATTSSSAAAAAAAGGASGGSGSWLSGASGPAANTGLFATWRGSSLGIIGTWSDNNDAMVNMWQLQSSGELGSWRGPLDMAIGAIGQGESWKQAAAGAYDARWSESLEVLKSLRSAANGTTYIRFAHEMNGNWYPWSVDSSERADFISAWHRFRALQQQIFPEAQLVFCLNKESVGSGFDWRQSWPGDDQVDVLGVDYYNMYPYAATAGDFTSALTLTDQWGAPKGLAGYQQFARAHGVPLAVPEWSGQAEFGDSPAFIQAMHDWFAANAGSGPGQLRYEILFDIDNADYAGKFILSSGTHMPLSAEAYRRLF